MTKKVLLAVGRKDYATLLRDIFSKKHEHFNVLNEEVVHRRFLYEIIETTKPEIILLHDKNVVSDLPDRASQDEELIQFILKMRLDYDDSIRFVILCERPDDDPFLSRLANLGVFDIFNSNSIQVNTLLEQLMVKPKFSNVEKYINTAESKVPITMLNPKKAQEDEKSEEDKENSEKKSKVKEKPVVQKVVNKNVIKRDYHIQVHNHNEKVIGVPVKKSLILIGSPLKRSGSSFVSHLLARSIAKMGISTAYIESPFSQAYTFDRFMGNHLTDPYRSKFYHFSQQEDMDYTTNWNKDGVNLICKHPVSEPLYKNNEITFEIFMKVLFQSDATVTIVDVGTDWNHELFKDVMDIADHTYYVMEPDLPFIQSFEESKEDEIAFMREKLAQPNTGLIGNRFDKSILENELIKESYSEDIISVFPTFSSADIFEAQYNGKFLNDIGDYENQMKESLEPILIEILPEEFLKSQNKRTGFFKSLFHKKISIQRTESKGEVNV